jgi:ribosome modulation factor
MARQAKRQVTESAYDDQPAEPQGGSNCSDETKRSAYREALILKIAAEGAAEAAKSKLGSYRAYLKAAAKRGVPSDAITFALAKRFEDPDLVLIEQRERLRMLEISGYLPGIRDKLLSRFDVQEATYKEEEENQVLIAYDKGAMAGRQGHASGTCPYPENSKGERKWLDGWRAGQMAIASELGEPVLALDLPDTEPAAGKVRRGKKAEPVNPPSDHSGGDLPGDIPAAVH